MGLSVWLASWLADTQLKLGIEKEGEGKGGRRWYSYLFCYFIAAHSKSRLDLSTEKKGSRFSLKVFTHF